MRRCLAHTIYIEIKNGRMDAADALLPIYLFRFTSVGFKRLGFFLAVH